MTGKRVPWHVLLRVLAIVGVLATPHLASPHPLGNFSISHYTAIRIEPNALTLRYIIDMAEIPTFQEIQDTKIVPQEGHPSLPAYLAQRVEALRAGLILELNGQRLPLSSDAGEVVFPPGAGGLPTLKLGMRFRAPFDKASAPTVHELRYRDTNFSGRAGWKEIIATGGQGITLVSSTAPERDRSQALADYPTDLLNSPPQEVEARVVFARQAIAPQVAALVPPSPWQGEATKEGENRSGGIITVDEGRAQIGRADLVVNHQPTPRNSFTELVTTQQLSFGIVLVAMAVSVGLGAFHALEPGHGKTVVAAYLVGSRGTTWHAMLLGLIVTVTHTAGVYFLGVVTLFASRYMIPERLYSWLGVMSGLVIATLGCSLFLRRYTGWDHSHSNDHGHGHSHAKNHPDPHVHTPGEEFTHPHTDQRHHHHPHAHPDPPTVSLRELLAVGVTGGIVPCPAALVVLLSALSLNRVGFGMLLIVAFSVGLASVLIAVGVLMVYAQHLMAQVQADGRLMTRWLPLTSAAVMTMFGITIAVQALVTAGILQIRL
jgi:ABC-type nickel/cobalt efflux system permease component RcnA